MNSDRPNINHIYTIMTQLLNGTTKQLAFFLESLLPSLINDWWHQSVVNKLSFQQRRRLEQQNITSLSQLDLAALVRVLDQNWYQISTKLDLTAEARHFVKEMQTVRNRWAHAGTEKFAIEDIYRDLDTIQRFASAISANEDFLNEVCATKASLLAKVVNSNMDENAGLNTSVGIDERKAERGYPLSSTCDIMQEKASIIMEDLYN